MGFKKHNWLSYGRNGKIVEITIREDNRKIDFFRCDNEKDYKKIIKIVRDKYGFDFKPEISPQESINFSIEKEKKDSLMW